VVIAVDAGGGIATSHGELIPSRHLAAVVVLDDAAGVVGVVVEVVHSCCYYYCNSWHDPLSACWLGDWTSDNGLDTVDLGMAGVVDSDEEVGAGGVGVVESDVYVLVGHSSPHGFGWIEGAAEWVGQVGGASEEVGAQVVLASPAVFHSLTFPSRSASVVRFQ